MTDSRVTTWLPDLSRVKVLIIEDDEDSRKILVEVLQFAGARVTGCSDAYSALHQLDGGFRPDVIICDLALPRMDGVTFVQALRAHRDVGMRRTPVIAVTAYDEVYGPTQLHAAGCEAYMAKPLSLERVCLAIEKLALSTPRSSEERKAS